MARETKAERRILQSWIRLYEVLHGARPPRAKIAAKLRDLRSRRSGRRTGP